MRHAFGGQQTSQRTNSLQFDRQGCDAAPFPTAGNIRPAESLLTQAVCATAHFSDRQKADCDAGRFAAAVNRA